MPLTSLTYLVTSPHVGPLSLLWLLPLVVTIALDFFASAEERAPAAPEARWDRLLVVLFGLQILNVVLGASVAARDGFHGWGTVVGIFLVGLSSGYSGIVVAHELMHRSSTFHRVLSRILMVSVLYEHFFTEHLRGHHVRVGTPADAATARFGESFFSFFLRTVPAQFRSAWDLERHRCGLEAGRRIRPAEWMRHRVAQGVCLQAGTILLLALFLGPMAVAFHVGQAVWAITLLECVNYFEHWGLVRQEQRVRTIDSWDTDSKVTLNTLVGLSRHADHHAHASRPYHQLRHTEESPKLPMGYFAMVPYVLLFNQRFRRTMTAELQRFGLGPFAQRPRVRAASA